MELLRGAKDGATVCAAESAARVHFAEEAARGSLSAAHRDAHEAFGADLRAECDRVVAGGQVSAEFVLRLDASLAAHEEEHGEGPGPLRAQATAKPAPATHPSSAESTAVGAVRQSVLVPKCCTRPYRGRVRLSARAWCQRCGGRPRTRRTS